MKHLCAVLVAVVATTALQAPAQAGEPIKSLATFSARMNGGVITSPHLHITVSVVGRYGFYRSYHGHVHEFYGFTISAQHCKPGGCWGRVLHARLPVHYPRGRPVAGKLANAVTVPCWVHGCVNPVRWAKNAANKVGGFSDWIGRADEWFFANITGPCLLGTAGGWATTAAYQLARRAVFLGGFMSQAKLAAGVAGPDGYAVAGVAGCSLTLGSYGLRHAGAVARKLGAQL